MDVHRGRQKEPSERLRKTGVDEHIFQGAEAVGGQLVHSVPGGMEMALSAEFPQPCPKVCLCKEEARFVNCSGVSLSGSLIFPLETEHLDLSNSGLHAMPSLALRSLWKLQVLLLCGNDIAEVERGAFQSLERLQKLDISGNMITVLGSSFSAGLSSLLELSLSHNRIQAARFRSFQNFENLQKLNIQNNNISSIEPGAFRSLTRLRQLHLQNNQLLSLHDGVFSMLQHLEILNLEGNRIKKIGPGVFTPLSSLTILNLEHNCIERIRFKTFLTLQTAGTHILLSDNPWFCDCDLQRVFSKLHSVRRLVLDRYENITCTEPAVLRNIPLASVDTQLCAAEMATVLIITITALVSVVAAIVMAERNRRRRTGKHWSEDNELSYSIHW
ncbi:insulin-like growth factor-binding protein complex acid labile subunit [Nothoprocta perdicaria]|uniref:insulin-like growth factor-binding protein complex acid labile subunit n=1 Tax=Nothoprocta perdicaria TaxID=30464 RepID=UPI000E1B7746|nr:insulin-like growth factor-binding protein complex acid labile subunit [Nothoprocta perdicaria]